MRKRKKKKDYRKSVRKEKSQKKRQPVSYTHLDVYKRQESWWEKRHEEFEEIIAEQIKEAQEKARAQKELAWANYLNSQLVSQQRLQGFLIESVQSGQDRTNISAFQPMGVSAYEDTISTFSKSVIESQKL